MTTDTRYDEILADINTGINDARTNRSRRQELLNKIQDLDQTKRRRVAVYYAQPDRSLSHADVLPFTSMLKSIGHAESLDLVVASSGGDGTAAEKMLDLCRRYCREELRVVVPLYAKSAATLLALGSDTIIMGETSELGPIDAQVFIIEGNKEQQISADHFLRARDEAVKNLGSPDQIVVQAAQIQLALLSPPFLQHCQDLMDFAKDFAGKQLRAHMFQEEWQQDSTLWNSRIDKIIETLESSSKHLTHGRMITGQAILEDPDLRHLKVKLLPSVLSLKSQAG